MYKKAILLLICLISASITFAQCVMCTKTAASLDDNSARGLNGGIIYLAFMPLTFMLIIGYKWWKQNKETL